MPELPEIETIKLQLQKVLRGKVITDIEIFKQKSFQGKKELVTGKKVLRVKRIGKMLLLDLEGEIDMAIHLRMTGQLIYIHNLQRIAGGHPTPDFTGELPSKHTRVVFRFDKDTMYFNDQRIFGFVKVGTKKEIEELDFLKKMGPEPWDIDRDKFPELFRKPRKPIKIAIMDQEIISGVGNIYANDALWEAGIYPGAISNQLSAEQLTELHKAITKVLREGIKYGGATAGDDKYVNLEGLGGHYQDHFRVYDREGEKCLRPACRQAGAVILKIALGGRGTYYCPRCQK
jgi:formamidopyrimidine-DNA glycosylase